MSSYVEKKRSSRDIFLESLAPLPLTNCNSDPCSSSSGPLSSASSYATSSPIFLARPSFTNLSDSCFDHSQFSLPHSACNTPSLNTPSLSPISVPYFELDCPLYQPSSRRKSKKPFMLPELDAPLDDEDNVPNANIYSGSDFKLIGPVQEGVGGVYLVQNLDTLDLKVFKPTEEEGYDLGGDEGNTRASLKRGVDYGHATLKEIAACALDHDHFASVPHTEIGSVDLDGRWVRGSLQDFQSHVSSCEDMGSSRFDVTAVHKLGLLDLRLLNLDRHLGNILVTSDGDLVPIDHGYILPSYEDLTDVTIEWLYWHQCKAPFSDEVKEYVYNLDASEDARSLQLLGIPFESLLAHFMSTMFLQACVKRGMTLFEIGSLYVTDDEKLSPVEELMKGVVRETKPSRNFYQSQAFSGALRNRINAVLDAR